MFSGLFCYLSKRFPPLSKSLSKVGRIRWTNRNVKLCMDFSRGSETRGNDSHEISILQWVGSPLGDAEMLATTGCGIGASASHKRWPCIAPGFARIARLSFLAFVRVPDKNAVQGID